MRSLRIRAGPDYAAYVESIFAEKNEKAFEGKFAFRKDDAAILLRNVDQ